MAEVIITPKKRKLSINENMCCFCFKNFEKEKPRSLRIDNFDTLLTICRDKSNDDSSIFLIENEHKIRDGDIKIRYHKKCRSAFVHPFYNADAETDINLKLSEKFTRSKENPSFDFKNCCFICGERCLQKKRSSWSLVHSSIDTSSSMYVKVLEAAKQKNDQVVVKRLLGVNSDLVAAEARYHRNKNCLTKYLKKTETKKPEAAPEKNRIEEIALLIKDKYIEDIEIHGKVIELQVIKNTFITLASEKGMSYENIRNRTLKRVISKVWPEVRFVSQTGIGSFICSASVSVEEALNAACRFGKVLSAINEENVCGPPLDPEKSAQNGDDEKVLHRAADIIRQRMKEISKLDKEYFSPEECSLHGQKMYVDETLYKFLGWITNNQHFENVSNAYEDTECDPKLLALCSDMIFAATSAFTPKHQGLAVYLHHLYGSRKMIDDMHSLGYTISYTELRHFLTSAAVHMTDTQKKTVSGALVPSDIMHRQEGGHIVIAAGDNWDHNECTATGKHTTHAMTTILVSPKSNNKYESRRISKVSERTTESLDIPGGTLSRVLTYNKPSTRPCPAFAAAPLDKNEVRVQEPEAAKICRLKELLYNLRRSGMFIDDRFESTPTWNVFQTQVTPDILQESSEVVFNPIIMSTPTHYNTVYTTLKRLKDQMNALGQDSCPVVFDMGLLTKALEVVWARPAELDGVIPTEGGMHFLMSVFAGIGFLYGDAGLSELLTDSDVFAFKTVKQIMAGKDFDRAIKAFLMIDEVLHNRLLINFRKWCESRNALFTHGMPLQSESGDTDGILSFIETNVAPLLKEFREKGRELSPTFQFWDDFLNHVSTPFKLFLSSSRHAIWNVHEYAKSQFLPFFFASNRSIYAKYMPYLVLSMQRLPVDVRESFMKGKFVAKLTNGTFNSVWIDYCLEVTENKSLKSNGGIIGLTHRDEALNRWFLSRPLTAKYYNTYRTEGLGKNEKSSLLQHHTDNNSYKKQYDENINKMLHMFDETFLDPFCIIDAPNKLVNFATGISVSSEVETSLLSSYKKGSDCLDKFVDERLVVKPGKESPQSNFYDPVSKVNVKTMATKQIHVKCNSKDLPINGEEMYLRLLAINALKKVPLQRVMGFENAPVPLSLFTDSGDMLLSKKADFMSKLEELVTDDVLTSLNSAECVIYDGMAVIHILQQLNQSSTVYREIAESFWHYILSKSKGSNEIHVVFDQYLDKSAKSQTRMKRGEDQTGTKSFIIQPEMKVTDIKHALGNTNFKRELTKFLNIFLAQNCIDIIHDTRTVIVSGGLGEKVVKITPEFVSFGTDLFSNQEEADTKMLLHAKYVATKGVQQLVIVSPDTDVLVLLVHHFKEIGVPVVYFQTGRKSLHTDMTRYIPVHEIVKALSQDQLKILLTVYCITGCDTCSSFFSIGKKSAFKLMIKKAHEFKGLSCVGDVQELTNDQISICTQFVGELYGQEDCMSLNALRTKKVLTNKHVYPRRLPPTDDSFTLHLLRCLFQLLVWKSALIPNHNFPSLTNFGYYIDNDSGFALPHLMQQPVAPPELLSDIVCTCNYQCETSCVCSSLEQPCTIACNCKVCVEGDETCCRNIYTFLSAAI